MSIQKRVSPNGTVYWRFDYRDLQGKRRAKSFKKKEDAKAYKTKVDSEISAGTHVSDLTSISIGEAGDLWLQRARFAINSLKHARVPWRRKYL